MKRVALPALLAPLAVSAHMVGPGGAAHDGGHVLLFLLVGAGALAVWLAVRAVQARHNA